MISENFSINGTHFENFSFQFCDGIFFLEFLYFWKPLIVEKKLKFWIYKYWEPWSKIFGTMLHFKFFLYFYVLGTTIFLLNFLQLSQFCESLNFSKINLTSEFDKNDVLFWASIFFFNWSFQYILVITELSLLGASSFEKKESIQTRRKNFENNDPDKFTKKEISFHSLRSTRIHDTNHIRLMISLTEQKKRTLGTNDSPSEILPDNATIVNFLRITN